MSSLYSVWFFEKDEQFMESIDLQSVVNFDEFESQIIGVSEKYRPTLALLVSSNQTIIASYEKFGIVEYCH